MDEDGEEDSYFEDEDDEKESEEDEEHGADYELWMKFQKEVFASLPLIATINSNQFFKSVLIFLGEIICMHGGISEIVVKAIANNGDPWKNFELALR